MNTIERNEIFELAYRFVTETNEAVFLTGKAGTGKTTFLKYLKENCSKNIIVAAPTGVAAINAGGVTLHSLFQLPFHPFLPVKRSREELLAKIRYNKERLRLFRKMDLLVIDEISMVRCDVMDAIDTILKAVRRNYNLPFGGVQLLCIGDLHQLPPVVQNQEWSILQEYYTSPFFFDSVVIKEQMPLLIELNKIYRQKEDSFVSLLNKVRNNQMTADDFEDLHLRYDPYFKPQADEHYITLTSHNNQAELINQKELQRLLRPQLNYKAVVDKDFPEHLYPADAELVLKEGAQVMFLKNDSILKRYFNGKIGTVKKLDKETIVVDCDGTEISVLPETWENSRYTLNRADGKLEQETLGTFTQYPLRLAWAITIHKSQGLTFEKVMIDAGAAFSSGQVYVALSRCTSLDGIVLLSKIQPSAIYSNDSVVKGQQNLTYKGSLSDRFVLARQIFTQQLLEEIFSFSEIISSIDLLLFHIKEQGNKLNPEAIEWAEKSKAYLEADKNVGLKFILLVGSLLKEEAVIEKNTALQKRICDAANHFEPRLSAYLNSIKNHPILTEHKETAAIINELLTQLYLDCFTISYAMQYCKEPFSVTAYLQHKLKFALPKINITCYASSKKQVYSDVPNDELFQTLKRWRDMICAETDLPIYIVANQSTLKEIATYLPMTAKDLLQITGMGKAKVEKYGDDILQAVESYCARYDLQTNMSAKPEKEVKEKSPTSKTDTKAESFRLYKEGKSINEIAKERNFTVSTIEGHLAHYVSLGEIEVDNLVAPDKLLIIKEAIKTHGTESSKVIKENITVDIGYGEIKLVLASLKPEA